MELPMILVDRGNCSFVTKARNIEEAGANVALIADDMTEYSELLMMADDGSGHSIHIPSFMLRKGASDHFKNIVENDENLLILSVNLELP
jgi:hypothetical protein